MSDAKKAGAAEQVNPYAAPSERAQAQRSPAEALANPFGAKPDRAELVLVAKYQRLIIFSLMLYFAGFVANLFGTAIGLLAYRGVLGLALYAIMGLAKTLFSTAAAVVFVLLTFIPVVNLLVLLVLNRRATTRLREGGINVGFLGANPRQFAS